MSITININGEILSPENAKISVFDRGFLFGDSIYEVTYSKNKTLLFFEEHLDRLWNSASLIGMEIQITREELSKRVLDTAKASQIENAYVRIVITRGIGELNINPTDSPQNVVIFIKPNVVHPKELYERGISLALAQRPRNDKRSLDPNAKSGNYLNNVLALQEAKKAGADDAIMANTDGLITEGTTFNIWMVKDGVVMTPHPSSGLLKGITRQKVLDICETNGIPHKEQALSIEDLRGAQELFITSSTKAVMPVYKLDGNTYALQSSERPLTQKLVGLYNRLVDEHLSGSIYTY